MAGERYKLSQTQLENYKKEVETLRESILQKDKLIGQYEQKNAKFHNVSFSIRALTYYM